jgi:hypothetical protein
MHRVSVTARKALKARQAVNRCEQELPDPPPALVIGIADGKRNYNDAER